MTVSNIAPVAIRVMIATSILVVLATVAIVLRFKARSKTRNIGVDDWVALAAYVFLLSVTVCHYLVTGPYGWAGNPQSEFSLEQLRHFLIILYADNLCYTCCTVSVKLSITLFLRRVFATRPIRIITAALTAILIVWWITVLLFQIFSCTPVVSFWEVERREHCIDTNMFYDGVAISNVLFDFILLFIPIPMVWQLQMNLQRKLQVSFVFILGGFTIVCSILRTISLRNLDVNDETGTHSVLPLFPKSRHYLDHSSNTFLLQGVSGTLASGPSLSAESASSALACHRWRPFSGRCQKKYGQR